MTKCIFHDRIKFTKFNTLLYFLLKRGQASEEKNFLCFLFLLWFILSCNSVILLNSHASELYRGMYQEQIQKHTVSLSYFFIGSLLNKHQTLWKIFSKILKIMFFRIRLSSETGFYNIQVGTQTYYCTQTHIQYSSYIIPKKRILPLEIDL